MSRRKVDFSTLPNTPWKVQFPKEDLQVAGGTWWVTDSKGHVICSLYRCRSPMDDEVIDARLQAHAVVEAVNILSGHQKSPLTKELRVARELIVALKDELKSTKRKLAKMTEEAGKP